MPLFEYACKDCHRQFEVLMRAQETPACPSCEGTHLERQLSTFAAHTASGASGAAAAMPSFGGCGSCGDPRGPGACSMN